MTDVIFGIIILGLIAFFAYYIQESNKEKAKLLNAVIAKTPEQVRDLNMVDKLQLKTQPQPVPDLVPMENLNDEEFDEHITNQLN